MALPSKKAVVLKLGQWLGSLRGWVWIASVLGPPAATFVAGLFEGLPTWQVIPWATFALVCGTGFGFFALRGYEIVSGWYGLKQQGERLAKEFQDLMDVGQKDMPIAHAAELWAGRDANAYEKLVCLRRLKQAADEGLIAYTGAIGGRASKDSKASLADLATFFSQRRWRTLPPLPPQNASRARPVKSVERTNWVKNWRR